MRENEGRNVKITNLVVRKLYGHYDYDVNFNEDMTFLFGSNGSGKTTILNMLSAVVTGELYRLFDYSFESLDLNYSEENVGDGVISIKLISNPENPSINFTFKDEEHSLSLIEPRSDFGYMQPIRDVYFRNCVILREIENLFPFIYLPLNRKDGKSWRNSKIRGEHTVPYFYMNEEDSGYDVDSALLEAKNKIADSQHVVNQKKQTLDRKFRDDLFKSLIAMKKRDIASELTQIEVGQFETLLDDYTQAIKGMGVLDAGEFEEFTADNRNLVGSVNDFIEGGKKSLSAALAVNFYRAWQAREITELTNILQSNLEKEDHKLNSFMNTINSFFGDGEDAVTKKSLYWNAGKIGFRNDWDRGDVDLSYLSSGEKQLFIFFTHLIFSLEDNQPGILIVDEPELSLHLAWQREYVNKIIELNPNVQIIFATHAPEIVGKYTEKMLKLCPVVSQNKEEV